MNISLKRAIKSEGRSQIWISKQLGVSTTRISRIIHGTQRATDEEKRQLAELLGQRLEELFLGKSEESASA